MSSKKFIYRRVALFLGLFAALYLGAQLLTGLAAPGGLYSPWVDSNFDIVSGIKHSLMAASQWLLGLFGQNILQESDFILRHTNGGSVLIGHDCAGTALFSFWIAFVIAMPGSVRKKIFAASLGLLLLWAINVVRVCLVLMAVNKGWSMPLGIGHHTWFNLVAYGIIIFMVWVYSKNINRSEV